MPKCWVSASRQYVARSVDELNRAFEIYDFEQSTQLNFDTVEEFLDFADMIGMIADSLSKATTALEPTPEQ